MSYVTQKRTIPRDQPLLYSQSSGNVVTHSGTWAGYTSEQETYSWRTGKSAPSSTSVENAESIPTTRRDAFLAYKKDRASESRPRDNGHDFWTTKNDIFYSHPSFYRLGTSARSYIGPVIPNLVHAAVSGTFPVISGFDSSYYGPRAIAATTPTKSVGDLALTLAELKREGIPTPPGSNLILRSNRVARRGSQDWLAYNFAFIPTLAAVQDLSVALMKASAIIKQYKRDSGKWTRRTYTFPTERWVTTRPEVLGGVLNIPNSSTFSSIFPISRSLRFTDSTAYTRNVRFSGAYSYHLPITDTFMGKMKRYEAYANKLVGTRITPEVLWNLAPWSWFGDWNNSFGKTIANVSSMGSDGLVIAYGYLMCHTVAIRTVTLHNVPGAGDVSLVFRTVRKERVKASPYGFGSNPASYSAKQWSILGALGLTKAPKTLW